MTWELLAALITIFTACVTLCTLIFKLSRTLTALEAAVKALIEYKSESKEEHDGMHKQLDDHEKRINILEYKTDMVQ